MKQERRLCTGECNRDEPGVETRFVKCSALDECPVIAFDAAEEYCCEYTDWAAAGQCSTVACSDDNVDNVTGVQRLKRTCNQLCGPR